MVHARYLCLSFGFAMAAWSSPGLTRQILALPGVDNPTGQLSGIDTSGAGSLTVGAGDNINTSNDAGGGITSSAADTATVLFTGSSTVTGATGNIGTTLLNITAGAPASTATFNGPVYATTFNVGGTGTVIFNGGFTSNSGSTVDFAGDGSINLGPGQTLTGAITNSAGANTGTLTLNGGSNVVGAVAAASGLKQINVVGGNASITGATSAYSFNLGTNTLAIAGALAIPAGATMNTTVANNAVFGKIVPSGFATVGSGLQINVTVNSAIANGSSFDVVAATSGSSGSVVTASDTSARYLFSASNPSTGIVRMIVSQIPLAQIIVTPPVVVTPPVLVPPPAVVGTPPAVVTPPVVVIPPVVAPPSTVKPVQVPVTVILPVAAVIDTAPTLTIQNPISVLTTPAAVIQAVSALVPGPVITSTNLVSYRAISQFQNLWSSHLESVQDRCQSESKTETSSPDTRTCSGSKARDSIWGKGFGNFSNQGAADGFAGYDSQIFGAMIGYDTPIDSISDNVRAGLGIGYSHSTLTGLASNDRSRIGTYQATAYIGVAPGAWYLDGAVTIGLDRYNASRNILFPGVNRTANSDFNGQQYTALITGGYHIDMTEGFTITPLASLQYTHLTLGGYEEKNAGDISLKAEAQDYNFVESGLGAKLARPIATSGGTFVPEMHAKWLHGFSGLQMKLTSAFIGGGSSFTTLGRSAAADTYDVGTGIDFLTCDCTEKTWALAATYDYQWRNDNFSAHQGLLKLTYRF